MSLLGFFFFNDTATTEIYTLSLHDALPISIPPMDLVVPPSPRLRREPVAGEGGAVVATGRRGTTTTVEEEDRKSTRLNSSHANISYAVFCLKKNTMYNGTRQWMLNHSRRGC